MLEWSGRSRAVGPTVLKLRVPKPRAARAEMPLASAVAQPGLTPAPVRDTARPIEGPKALGAMLCERGLLTEMQLQSAILRQQQTGRRLGHVLVELGFVTAEAVLEGRFHRGDAVLVDVQNGDLVMTRAPEEALVETA